MDEIYVSEVAGKLWHRPDGKLPRGLSRNKICIGVSRGRAWTVDFHPGGERHDDHHKEWNAFGDRISPGSRLVHDMETAHNKLVEELRLKSEVHNGTLLMGTPDELNPLDPVNEMHFLLKAFLKSHSGFNRDDLQGYLDLFHVIVNEPNDRMEKAAMVLDRAMTFPKTLRFREFYNVRPRSDDCPAE